ncbi:ribonuclease H-like domain-containing protein, partial [Infundibulicybe gibba]
QARFNSMIARITASCGFPFLWVENPEWLRFVKSYRAMAKLDCKGQNSTLQYDGWTGINNHHFLVFQMSVSNRTIHTVCVIDTSGERKTADLLYQKLRNVKEKVEAKWGVVVVAITGDASGESLRARKDLVRLSPHLLAPDCYAHQINLMVSDYFKAPNAAELLAYGEDATELITWLRSKTFVLAKIRAVQDANGYPILSVRRAVLTRWTSHYSAYERLLKLRLVLELVVTQDQNLGVSDIITGKRAAKDKAQAMIKKIQDSMFWYNLARLKKHLEPLALAANITQLSHIRPDQVLITFGILYTQYNTLMTEDTSYQTWAALQAVLDSIEKQWKKTEQSAFIGSVILNPIYKLKPFHRSCDFMTLAGAISLLKELYIRFFEPLSEDGDQAFFEEASEYLNNYGRYRDLSNHAQHISKLASRAANPPASVAGETAQSSDRDSLDSIYQIITQLGQLEDNDDSARLETPIVGTNSTGENPPPPREPILIKELFNFQDDTWAEIAKAASMRGLEEEMELYDLVDLDAAGEDDDEVVGRD